MSVILDTMSVDAPLKSPWTIFSTAPITVWIMSSRPEMMPLIRSQANRTTDMIVSPCC